MTRTPLLLVMCLASRGAWADAVEHVLGYPGIPDTSGPMPDPKVRLDLGLGYDLGNVSAHGADGIANGFHVAIGLRFDRLTLLAESSWMWAAFSPRPPPTPSVVDLHPVNDAPSWGYAHRDLVLARYSIDAGRQPVYRKHSHRLVGVSRYDDWLELGVGRELIDLHPGGSQSRPIASIGFGVQTSGRDDTLHGGAYLGLRILAGQAAGGGFDHEAMLALGFVFGN